MWYKLSAIARTARWRKHFIPQEAKTLATLSSTWSKVCSWTTCFQCFLCRGNPKYHCSIGGKIFRYKIFLYSVDAMDPLGHSEALQLHGKGEFYYDLNESGCNISSFPKQSDLCNFLAVSVSHSLIRHKKMRLHIRQ